MLRDIVLPRLGQTMEEGTIERWHKKEGDKVRKGEVLYELTTDKATLEVESFADGVLRKILVGDGQTVPVNELIAILGDEKDELPSDLEAYRARAAAAAVSEEEVAGKPAAAPQPAAAAEAPAPASPPRRILASPRAKKVAEELKAPLAALRGSGPEGRIIERDVLEFAEKVSRIKSTASARQAACEAGLSILDVEPSEPGARISKEDVLRAAAAVRAPAKPAAAPRPGGRAALSPMRQTIARRMSESKQTIPHFYLVGDVQMRKALEKRQQLNASGELHITITDLIVRAVALALKAHPRMNARFDGNAIVFNPQINVGVAVAVADGLFVPVVKNADSKGIAQVSAELKSLAQAARAGKLIPEQYEGGSITISNLGAFGVDYFLPIINPPEAAILGIGRVAEQAVVQEGAIRIEPVMKVALSADHRVVDGAEAAKFFQSFQELLERAEQI